MWRRFFSQVTCALHKVIDHILRTIGIRHLAKDADPDGFKRLGGIDGDYPAKLKIDLGLTCIYTYIYKLYTVYIYIYRQHMYIYIVYSFNQLALYQQQ